MPITYPLEFILIHGISIECPKDAFWISENIGYPVDALMRSEVTKFIKEMRVVIVDLSLTKLCWSEATDFEKII